MEPSSPWFILRARRSTAQQPRTATPWSERWDIYFQDQARDNDIHWFAITNSVLIVLMLSFMVGIILMRALNRDISAYNDDTLDDLAEETGWKLVHGDVFRGPQQYPMLLSVFVGCGSQLFLMTLLMLIFACLGFLSPANRGGLLTVLVFLFVFAGVVSGYKSARLYKLFDGKDWKRNALLSAAGPYCSLAACRGRFVLRCHQLV